MFFKRKQTIDKEVLTIDDIGSLIGRHFTHAEVPGTVYTISMMTSDDEVKVIWTDKIGLTGSRYYADDVIKYINEGIWVLKPTT